MTESSPKIPMINEIILILLRKARLPFLNFNTANNPPNAKESICDGNNIVTTRAFPPYKIVKTLKSIETVMVNNINLSRCLTGTK